MPDGGSLRGTYFGFFRYTALSPGLNSSRLKMYGPEPMCSSICLKASVSAMRLGMMNGTFDDGLPSASSTKPQASPRKMRKVSGAGVSMRCTNVHQRRPHRVALAPALQRGDRRPRR